MATLIQKIPTILSFLLYLTSLHKAAARDDDEAATANKNISWWCSTSPYPQPCNHYMNKSDPIFAHEFRTMTVVTALERAFNAKTRTKKLGYLATTTRDKMVHQNCDDELLENTILQLNSTLQSIKAKPYSADSDMQTWLSAALTNVETCTSGSPELSSLIGNVSEMIRNSLAANAVLLKNDRGDSDQVVTSDGDRKLLQNNVWASKANVVVSKDGSGWFSSIQEAIDYATGNRVGKKRVIVYVKKGVYEENVLINRTMNKVMLVGDGVRNTVITGNRSSSAGFTTYSTATFGKSITTAFTSLS